jgi:hypothetical protein
VLDTLGTPYPEDVSTGEQRRRWDKALEIAVNVSKAHEPSGEADQRFVFQAVRSIYESDIPT